MIRETKLITRTQQGTLVRSDATLGFEKGRILFLESPFALKDEIKAMRGSKWHGHDESDGRKIWSVEDCPRNRFQLSFLEGDDTYAWFDREMVRRDYSEITQRAKECLDDPNAEFMDHQADMTDSGLMYHYQLWAAEMGTGKTLAAQIVIELSGVLHWWWVGPKSSLANMRREFKKFKFPFLKIEVEFLSYEDLKKRMENWNPEVDRLPQGMILDESSRLKGEGTQRTNAAQYAADLIRDKYGFDGYVIEMSGTPSPKSPLDWWAQCEIAWPGFLKEGSRKALERRLAFLQQKEFSHVTFLGRTGWRDNEDKCNVCGQFPDADCHQVDRCVDLDLFHRYEKSINEVAYMHDRLHGLVVIKHKKDCLSLPEKRYRKIYCKPNPSTLRLAKALADTTESAIMGMTLLRELSDGFQYREVQDGTKPCDHCSTGFVDEWYDPDNEDRTFAAIDMLNEKLVARLMKREVACPRCNGSRQMPRMERITKQLPCPKDEALKMLLEECEETGRIVIFAGYVGSVDRITELCRKQDWAVVRCDGRGFEVSIKEGKQSKVITNDDGEALDYWADTDTNPRVAFVAHPESGGMSLTLVESRMCVYWSNSFKPEYRAQSEDRIHRKGMDENLGCEIVDLIHLPTDERVLKVIQENRTLELMTMGEFRTVLEYQTVEDLAA